MFFAVLRHWLPLALLIVFSACLTYVVVQQVYRQSANDPQIQMAEDAVRALESGSSPTMVASAEKPIDISLSLAPFLAVFDEQGALLSSTGMLHRDEIRIPAGTFDYARANGEHRFSWQPEPGVRQAVVLVLYEKGEERGFVLAGRSLRESEARVKLLTNNILLATFVTLCASLLLSLLFVWSKRRFS